MSVPVAKILKLDIEGFLRVVLSRFGTAEQPFLPVTPIGQCEIVTLARAVLASKIPYREIFKHDAKPYAMPQEALHVWELPVAHMPGPEEQANRYYLWGHGTTPEGVVGILTLGRVLRSSIEALQVAQYNEVFVDLRQTLRAVQIGVCFEAPSQHKKQCRSSGRSPPAQSMRAICASFTRWCIHLRVTSAGLSVMQTLNG